MLLRIVPRSLPSRLAAAARPPPARRSIGSRSRARRLARPITVRGSSKPTVPPSAAADGLSAPSRDNPSQQEQEDQSGLQDDDPLNLRGTRPEEPVIRFFEQDVSQVGEAPPRPVSAAHMESDERKAADLWRKIGRLEAEIRELEQEDELSPSVMRLQAIADDRVDADIEMLADADPEKVRAELDALRVPAPSSVTGDKGASRAHLDRLNNCLRHAHLATDPNARPIIRQELWKAYKRAKLRVPRLLEQIPAPAWDMLFYSQAVRWKSNSKREEHMRELQADMKSVGMDGPPTPPPDQKGSNDVD